MVYLALYYLQLWEDLQTSDDPVVLSRPYNQAHITKLEAKRLVAQSRVRRRVTNWREVDAKWKELQRTTK